jgi:hypothetical protein
LTSHGDNGRGVRNQIQYTQHLGDGLILIKCPEAGSNDLSVIASEGDALYVLLSKALVYRLECLEGLGHESAEMALVGSFVGKIPILVNDYTIDAHRTNVDAHSVHDNSKRETTILGGSLLQ